tara:strand:+ start:765 stop:1340 length:576 start_codon:yes stop_codon:yes gene_type:complete
MLPLAMSAAPLEGFENNKSILNSRKNKTIKKEPFENKHASTIENLENSINKIKTIHNSEDDSPELANFVKEYQHANYDSKPLPPPKMINDFPDNVEENVYLNQKTPPHTFNQNQDYSLIEGDYKNIKNNSNINPPNKEEMIKKLDYLIYLLENQKDIKSGSVTEELILYSFLGVFIIYVLDSFVKVAKYTR